MMVIIISVLCRAFTQCPIYIYVHYNPWSLDQYGIIGLYDWNPLFIYRFNNTQSQRGKFIMRYLQMIYTMAKSVLNINTVL